MVEVVDVDRNGKPLAGATVVVVPDRRSTVDPEHGRDGASLNMTVFEDSLHPPLPLLTTSCVEGCTPRRAGSAPSLEPRNNAVRTLRTHIPHTSACGWGVPRLCDSF